jgi:hypothetical protein
VEGPSDSGPATTTQVDQLATPDQLHPTINVSVPVNTIIVISLSLAGLLFISIIIIVVLVVVVINKRRHTVPMAGGASKRSDRNPPQPNRIYEPFDATNTDGRVYTDLKIVNEPITAETKVAAAETKTSVNRSSNDRPNSDYLIPFVQLQRQNDEDAAGVNATVGAAVTPQDTVEPVCAELVNKKSNNVVV